MRESQVRVLREITRRDRLSEEEIRRLLHLSRKTVQLSLKDLEKQGLIKGEKANVGSYARKGIKGKRVKRIAAVYTASKVAWSNLMLHGILNFANDASSLSLFEAQLAIERKDIGNASSSFAELSRSGMDSEMSEILLNLHRLFATTWKRWRLSSLSEQERSEMASYEESLYEYLDPDVLQMKKDFDSDKYADLRPPMLSLGMNVYERMTLNLVEHTITTLKKNNKYRLSEQRARELKVDLYNKRKRALFESLLTMPKMALIIPLSGFNPNEYEEKLKLLSVSLENLKTRRLS